MARIAPEIAVESLSHAAAALATLTDERVPGRVFRCAQVIDSVVGQSMQRLVAAKRDGWDMPNAVAAVSGAIRVMVPNVDLLKDMPEAAPFRMQVAMLSRAFAPFAQGAR